MHVFVSVFFSGACWSPHLTVAASETDAAQQLDLNKDKPADTKDVSEGSSKSPFPPESEEECSRFLEFLAYIPSFLSGKSSQQHTLASLATSQTPLQTSASTPSSIGVDKTAVREEITSELSLHIVNLINVLTVKESWKNAASSVLSTILSRICTKPSTELSSFSRLDVLGDDDDDACINVIYNNNEICSEKLIYSYITQ